MNVPTISHIYFLLDRSGSMASIADEVVEGFNRFLGEQQREGPDARMTLVQFDAIDAFDVLADAVPIREMIPLDHDHFVPRGGTPLLDALGRVIGHAHNRAKRVLKASDQPEDVLIAVFTDGYENASSEFTRTQIAALIERHEKEHGWLFAYLGANQDAFAEAATIGVQATNTMEWDADELGTIAAMETMSASTTTRRRALREGKSPRRFLGGEE